MLCVLLGYLYLTFIVVGSGRRLESKPGFPELSHHALIAGAIGGYIVWGRYDKANVQINLYLFSRVIIALGKKYGWNVEASTARYAWFSAVVWGIVMFLFEDEPGSLHSSLKMSMDEIYRYNLPASSL
jgi:peroxisomal membrane protein 4